MFIFSPQVDELPVALAPDGLAYEVGTLISMKKHDTAWHGVTQSDIA
jgi:hypothetical protein